MSSPAVSVVMNCYNGEKYLRQAIESVLAQTYQDWELVFWDNQSTDRSAEIFKSYPDARLRYFRAPEHTMLCEARNYAMEQSRGPLIAFLDVDDWWAPDKLAKQVPLFDDPDVGFVCANFWIENENKKKRWLFHRRPAPTGWVLDDLLRAHVVGLLTLVLRRSAVDSLAYAFDKRYHIIGDVDLGIRLSLRWKLDCAQEPLAFYRLHADNETAKHRGRQLDEMRTWMADMRRIDRIRSSPAWPAVEQEFAYLRAMNDLLGGRRRAALNASRELPWGKRRAKLSLGLLLPLSVVQRVKN